MLHALFLGGAHGHEAKCDESHCGSHGAARSARRGGRRTNAGRRRQYSPRDRRRKGDLDVPLRILRAAAQSLYIHLPDGAGPAELFPPGLSQCCTRGERFGELLMLAVALPGVDRLFRDPELGGDLAKRRAIAHELERALGEVGAAHDIGEIPGPALLLRACEAWTLAYRAGVRSAVSKGCPARYSRSMAFSQVFAAWPAVSAS
jgi:hypothetical protein